MSQRYTVTLHHIITVYNNMVDHMDGVMRASAETKTQWKEDLFFAVKLARQKLFKYNTEVTPTLGMLLISAHILDPFWKLRSIIMWDKEMDINPEDEISYTIQYQEAFLKSVANEYCTKHRRGPLNQLKSLPSSHLILSTTSSGSSQSSCDLYNLRCNDKE